MGDAGDAVFLFGGEEVRDDVVGVGGVGEAGGGEIGREEMEDFEERRGDGEAGGRGEGTEDGEFQVERREAEGVAATPDLESQDLVRETAGADVADLLGDVGLDPGIGAELPESVIRGILATAAGDEVRVGVVETNAQGHIAGLGVVVEEVGGQGEVEGRERAGSGGGEAEEEVDVAAAEGGALGVRGF